ncbi:hypothetical protein BP5796_03498 [Coleophoma crateriformis]|uniref:Peptidase M20 domain-containing protein 2 n=1 Tax=Coleophoma crateriformis TaxID=565419 RepID=A0A3D8SNN0_9HELO|nr:hypothetical protein BP5796_03498 [Coleophoma crateriformis]
MTQILLPPPGASGIISRDEKVRRAIISGIDVLDQELQAMNLQIHDCPELCYEEVQAHATLTTFLESQSIPHQKHTYGLPTSFEAEFGTGGRVVTFCAEYDALPVVGHGCGHNLIATASMAAFLGVVAALKEMPIRGRVRLLGCPAEEGGGGKIKLINAGAFIDVHSALMVHPVPKSEASNDGTSFGTCLAGVTFKAHFEGLAAHAGAAPWLGINALDAANLTYTAVGLLRQQCKPTDRIGIITTKDADTPSNIIADRATVDINVRAATLDEVLVLRRRVENCARGAAIATECKFSFEDGMLPYAEIRPNETICEEFTHAMATLGSRFNCDLGNVEVGGYGTDMGNVTYEVPGFHGTFAVPAEPGENMHSKGFNRASRTDAAHHIAVMAGKGMALAAWRILTDDTVAKKIEVDFENDKLRR